jgi:acyl dehydratase
MSDVSTSTLPVAPIALAVGDEMPAFEFGPLTRTDFVRYAGAGGDFNAIHHDEPYAQGAGLPSVFGMGMLPAGILGSRVAAWVGPDNLRAFAVRFSGQVWPGDRLTFSGRVTALGREGEPRAELELVVETTKGEPVMQATAEAAIAASD